MTIRQTLGNIAFRVFPYKLYVSLCYRHFTGRKFDFKNMTRFTEKRWYLKGYYRKYQKELIQLCYDKFTVREYVREKVGERYLTKVYGVYDSADDINFEKLPSKFVLKVTQSNGFNILCSDKEQLDVETVKKQLNEWLKRSNRKDVHADSKFYFTGNSKIMVEEYLENKEGKIPNDIKIFCFNGKPRFTYVTFDPIDEDGKMTHDYMINIYDENWEYVPVKYGDHPTSPDVIFDKPRNYAEMLDIATKLSRDFPFVRVDLYNVDGNIYFGELTWVVSSDSVRFEPDEYDVVFGKMLKLPNKKVF